MNDQPSDLAPDQMPETVDMEYDPVFLHARREAIIIFCTSYNSRTFLTEFNRKS